MRKDNVIDTRLLSSDAQLYESLFEKQYKKYKKHRNKFQRKIYGILIVLTGMLIADIIYIIIAVKFMH